MSILEFNDQEIMMIKNALDFRKKFTANFPKLGKKTDNISVKLEKPSIELKPNEKSILAGCIKTFSINPNLELINKCDYDIFLKRKSLKSNYLKIDIGNRILNKLEKEPSKKNSYKWLFDRFSEIESTKEIYYSITNDSKIYKVGIVLKDNIALYSELDEVHTLEKFCFGKLTPKLFTNKGTPVELIHLLDQYSNKNTLTKGQSKLQNILKESESSKS